MEAAALVIVILLANADDLDLAERLQTDLQARAQRELVLHIGQDGVGYLDKQGLTVDDLLVTPNIGRLFTKHSPKVVVMHLEQRSSADNHVILGRLWRAGKEERLGGIAGEGDDAYPLLRRQVTQLLGDALRPRQAATVFGTDASLADLVEAEAWGALLARLAEADELSVREHYYRVLAYSRIGNRLAAQEALNTMKEAHGQHFLVAAALELLPSKRENSPAAEETSATPTDEAEGAFRVFRIDEMDTIDLNSKRPADTGP